MPTPTSQGATVSWGGSAIGLLTNVRFNSPQAQFENITNQDSPVVGTGDNSRVRREYDCIEIEPGSVDISLFGVPPYSLDDSGERQSLVVTLDGGPFTRDAFLESFDASASVGAFLVGTARFRLA